MKYFDYTDVHTFVYDEDLKELLCLNYTFNDLYKNLLQDNFLRLDSTLKIPFFAETRDYIGAREKNNSDSIWKDDASGDYFGTGIIANFTNCTEEGFGIGVLQDYDNSMSQTNPVINRGDKAILYVRCSSSNNGLFNREIPVRTEISGRVVPEVGSPGVISFTSPMSYVDTIYKLQ